MKIRVKQTHIRRGEQSQSNSCPIALAVSELFRTSKFNVHVGFASVRIGSAVFELPGEAQRFIDAFDNKKSSVRPFEFEI